MDPFRASCGDRRRAGLYVFQRAAQIGLRLVDRRKLLARVVDPDRDRVRHLGRIQYLGEISRPAADSFGSVYGGHGGDGVVGRNGWGRIVYSASFTGLVIGGVGSLLVGLAAIADRVVCLCLDTVGHTDPRAYL